MMFWIIAGVVCVVLFALAWWTSGRSKRAAIDPRRALIKSDAYAQSQATTRRFNRGR